MSDYEPKCKKTLPIIFDDRMPTSNLTPKLVNRVNNNTEDLKNLYEETETIQGDIESLQEDVGEKLDIPETAGTAGQVLTSDGEGGAVWASVGSGEIVVDPTLTVEGAAADAKKTGNEITHLKQDNDEIKDGIYHNDLLDYFGLTDDGFAPTPVPCVVSYFNKVASTADAPFYPQPMGEWYPVQNLSAVYRYGILTLPAELTNDAVNIGFWVKYTNISATTSIRFSLADSNESRVADFSRYVASQLYVGATQTKNDCVAVVDAKINDWYHVTISVPASKGVAKILMGSDYFTATDRIYWSMPKVVKGTLHWFVNYKNINFSSDPYMTDPLYGKKVGWFGDSIMLGRHTGEDYGWYNHLRSLGCAVTVKAINGAMVSVKGAGYHSIIQETAAGVFDADTDYILFDGGANDFFQRQPLGTISESYSGSGLDTSTYLGAFDQVCYNLITNYPASRLGYIIPYKMETYADIQAQKTYFDNAIEVCKKWGIPVLDMRYMCDLNYNIASMQQYFKDDVHINKDGYIFTEDIIAGWLRGL